MDTAFREPGGFERYHLSATGPLSSATTELNAMATPAVGAAAAGSLLSLHNPLTWFGILAAVTLGLAAISTSVRVGPVKAGLQLGK
ncbi:MAG: hypothetical protein J0I40_06890 [Cellulomonas sp.]|uniref:hypothetical protein n=1 Tax=Cellulomonas sp. 73-92 TaxID=1895740 RepID=UPI000928B5C0|nr:hypothetical protein [Cellulomonas sp. 73-92]MBN9375105.1 hypothetical protein [Cellulomonas sp.]OJV76544.1 MAG: hypothetical protein BGO37_10875 [Cellulomonas sp. 73-92]